MYKMMVTAVALCSALIASPPVMAGWYVGVKTAEVNVDRPGVGNPTNVGVKLGRQWGVVAGDIGIEGEVSRTNDDARLGSSKVDVDTEGLYVAFRSAGPVYVIARGGMARRKLTIGSQSDTQSGESYGFGMGFSLALIQIELEYTQLPKGTDVSMVSLGIQF